MAISLRYAAKSDVGLVRSNNQDSAYAGPHLLVVADGMGGHAGGDVASSLAIGQLAPLDEDSHGSDAITELSQAISRAHDELLARVADEPQLTGLGTTVTALLRTGNRLALAHIGDSRAYVLREGELSQITHDHTFVQTLVDEGRITQVEAETHPQRSVLMRVLSDVVDNSDPDISVREARVGDRYLLCSDGLSGVVSFETLTETMAGLKDPAATCDTLVDLARRGGAPDNVTCIVADVVDDAALGGSQPFVVGAASRFQTKEADSPSDSAAERAAALNAEDANAEGTAEETDLLTAAKPDPQPNRRKAFLMAGLALLAVLALFIVAQRWVNSQLYVGEYQGAVAIYRGLPQNIGPISLSRLKSSATDIPLNDLPRRERTNLADGITVDNQAQADNMLTKYRTLAAQCRQLREQKTATTPPVSSSTSTAAPATTAAGGAVTAATTAVPTTGATLPVSSPPAGTGPSGAAATPPTTAPSGTDVDTLVNECEAT